MQALRAEMPQARFVYWADSGFAPYGERSDAFVIDRCHFITQKLQALGHLKAMVVACNTATAVAIEAIQKHKSAYLMAVGGAAYLVSKAIKQAKVVGFADLGMEAIYEFDVVDMPVTVAVDSGGTSAHITGPAEWQKRIATGEFKGIKVASN